MPTLDPSQYGGPIRGVTDCGCPEPRDGGTSHVPAATTDPCAPGEGNEAVEDDQHQCSTMVRIQGTIDRANRVAHTLGVRPYRVFLVWQERNRSRSWYEVHRKELIPVRISGLDGVDLSLSAAGLQPEGGVTLREVSPAQTNEDELRGYLNGSNWGGESSDREFFYEVVMAKRCAGESEPRRRRFILAAEPFLRGGAGEFRVRLVDQEIARVDGQDRTAPKVHQGPKLVT